MSASTSLKRQVAVITSSEARISGAIALLFAAAGAAIVIACVIAERYEKVRQRIADIDGSSLFCRVNLMDSEAIAITIGAVDTHFGRIDIPVNNAGGVTPRGFLKQSERSWWPPVRRFRL